jgi:hypothetical protein
VSDELAIISHAIVETIVRDSGKSDVIEVLNLIGKS